MILVPRSQSYTLALVLPARANATPTSTVYDAAGAELATPTVTRDTVATTLSGAAAAAAQTVSVTSATGIVVGRSYLLAGGESSGGESITVRSISGTTITLVRPLQRAAASGASFESARITVPIPAYDTPARFHRIEIAWALSTVTQPPFVASYDVVRYWPRSGLTPEGLRVRDPVLAKRLPAGTWLPDVIESAWDEILARVAQQVDPGALMGSLDLTIPHGYLVRSILLETAGAEAKDDREALARRYESTLAATLGASAVDNDQDGRVERHEGWLQTVSVLRG